MCWWSFLPLVISGVLCYFYVLVFCYVEGVGFFTVLACVSSFWIGRRLCNFDFSPSPRCFVGYCDGTSASFCLSDPARPIAVCIRGIAAICCDISANGIYCAKLFSLSDSSCLSCLSDAASSTQSTSRLSVFLRCRVPDCYCSFSIICCISEHSSACSVLVSCACVIIVITFVLFIQDAVVYCLSFLRISLSGVYRCSIFHFGPTIARSFCTCSPPFCNPVILVFPRYVSPISLCLLWANSIGRF